MGGFSAANWAIEPLYRIAFHSLFALPAALMMTLPAHGQDVKTATPAAECTCRLHGDNFNVGDFVCLSSPDGLRLAVCTMVQNNTSWKITESLCPFSYFDRLPGKDTHIQTALTAHPLL